MAYVLKWGTGMRHSVASRAALAVALVTLASQAAAQTLETGVVSPNLKVRPATAPALAPSAALVAAKNEFESFQVVIRASGGAADGVAVRVGKPLTGPGGATIPPENVVLYAVRYHDVGTASNSEGGAGVWPDPLVPDVDTYFGEKRNAFPLTVPDGESRAVWVDVLVPIDAAPGDYAGELEVTRDANVVRTIPVSLHVGSFALPSTASLKSAFGMAWGAPCVAHTGSTSCDSSWNEAKANELRALYLRSGLEHRFTISDTDYQPPLGSSAAHFEQWVLPLITGTGETRLPGARMTGVRLDGGPSTLSDWTSYAQNQGFFDRLFYYPVDEPGDESSSWSAFISNATALHSVSASARIIITSSIQKADAFGATGHVDVFVPVINHLEDKPGSDYAGNQRAKYDDWLASGAGRELWAYQSCMSHGCGGCGDETTDGYFTGWPQRVIDSSAVQNRAFSWVAFNSNVSAELYFDTTYQLSTAWDDNGQCEFSGAGDGTIFYPGKPSVIGGQSDVPVESIRMKLIRESMEDYEYLILAAQKDEAKTRAIALALFPHAYECDQTSDALESARYALFDMLDSPSEPQASGGSGGDSGGGGTAGGAADPDGDPPDRGEAIAAEGSCALAATPKHSSGALALVGLGLALALRVRSRTRRTPPRAPSRDHVRACSS